MKNKILLFLAIIISSFVFLTPAKALTKASFTEVQNGEIKVTLHFEEGFVGGLETKIKLKGNVNVKAVSFDSKIESGSNSKKAAFDNNTKTLTVKVTTGGIGASHNLLNEKKELVLGTIILASNNKDDVKYSFEKPSIKIINNDWNSATVASEHIEFDDDKEFTYIVNKTTTPEESKDPEEQKPSTGDKEEETKTGNTGSADKEDNNNKGNGTDNNNTGNANNNTSSNNNTSNNNDNQNSSNDENNSATTDKNANNVDDKIGVVDKVDNDADKVVSDAEYEVDSPGYLSDPIRAEEDKKKNSNLLAIITVCVAGAAAIGGASYYLLIAKKNKKGRK